MEEMKDLLNEMTTWEKDSKKIYETLKFTILKNPHQILKIVCFYKIERYSINCSSGI